MLVRRRKVNPASTRAAELLAGPGRFRVRKIIRRWLAGKAREGAEPDPPHELKKCVVARRDIPFILI
jgi:hypothetical protein